MVFLLLVSVLFEDPLPSFIVVGGTGSGDELKWHQLTHYQLMSPQGPHFCPQSTKPTIKAQISGRMASIGASDVVTASVYFEKTRPKKLMIMIINKSQEMMVFGGCQKLTFAMKVRP